MKYLCLACNKEFLSSTTLRQHIKWKQQDNAHVRLFMKKRGHLKTMTPIVDKMRRRRTIAPKGIIPLDDELKMVKKNVRNKKLRDKYEESKWVFKKKLIV